MSSRLGSTEVRFRSPRQFVSSPGGPSARWCYGEIVATPSCVSLSAPTKRSSLRACESSTGSQWKAEEFRSRLGRRCCRVASLSEIVRCTSAVASSALVARDSRSGTVCFAATLRSEAGASTADPARSSRSRARGSYATELGVAARSGSMDVRGPSAPRCSRTTSPRSTDLHSPFGRVATSTWSVVYFPATTSDRLLK